MRSVVNTLSSRVLGRRLGELRKQAGLSNSYVADAMGYSTAKLSRQEHGSHVVAVHELSHLVIHMYHCGTETLDKLEALRQQAARGRGWWTEYADDIPLHLQAYLELESEASEIDTCGIDVLPGLLQDAEYVRQQGRIFGSDPESIERSIWLRIKRQNRLIESTDPIRVRAIINEGAINRCLASGLRGQLESLVERAELPNVELLVLPDSAGIHAVTGIYVVLTLPGNSLPPVMYLEYIGGSIFVEEETAVQFTLDKHDKLLSAGVDGARFIKRFISQNRKDYLGVV